MEKRRWDRGVKVLDHRAKTNVAGNFGGLWKLCKLRKISEKGLLRQTIRTRISVIVRLGYFGTWRSIGRKFLRLLHNKWFIFDPLL